MAEMLFNTVQAAPVDVRSDLYKHVVLSGGSSMYPGLPSRLEKEMKQLYLTRVLGGDPSRLSVGPRAIRVGSTRFRSMSECNTWGFPVADLELVLVCTCLLTQKFKVGIDAHPTRRNMVFNGGAVLAEVMASNDAYWVTKAEWWVCTKHPDSFSSPQ